ncbi:MAG: cobamide remodeling phosphodiesterase CbiR [Desulfobacteraceae bacterium]
MTTPFPFRLGTTSFIYPDRIVPNVRKIGQAFDEIELLVFESRPETVLPSKEEIRALGRLSQELDVGYNVHLPTDISITDPSPATRQQGVEAIERVMALTAELSPSTCTLHLDLNCDHDQDSAEAVKRWQERTCHSLDRLVSRGVDLERISVETLEYPFDCLDNILDRFNLSVCVDAGHLIKCGFSIDTIFQRYAARIPIVHLHGVDFSQIPPRDHLSLEKTPTEKAEETMEILKNFHGVVSIEVFNRDNLAASLDYLHSIDWSPRN